MDICLHIRRHEQLFDYISCSSHARAHLCEGTYVAMHVSAIVLLYNRAAAADHLYVFTNVPLYAVATQGSEIVMFKIISFFCKTSIYFLQI